MLKLWYLQCISCKEWEAFGNVSYCILTHNSAENRHDHCHHFHQRGNGNREFVTCSRSHTEHGAELLGAELSPAYLVFQPQDDLSKWFVLGTCQRDFAFWGITCSASLHRIAILLPQNIFLCLTPVKSISVTIRWNSKSLRMYIFKCAINQLPTDSSPLWWHGMDPSTTLYHLLHRQSLLIASIWNSFQCRKVWSKYRFFFNFLKCTVCKMREERKECSSGYTVLHHGLSWSIIPALIRAKGITQ